MRLRAVAGMLFLALAAPAQVHLEDMDPTCKPCTDFWRYVNGGWLDRNQIPAHLSSWGTMQVLAETNRERLQTILETAAASSTPGKMGDLYASCMNTAAIDARGLDPLKPDFDRIAQIHTLKDLPAALAAMQRIATIGMSPTSSVVVGPFHLVSGIDQKNSSRVVARLVERDGAGGGPSAVLSLPDRDYYFKDDARSRDIRDSFVQYVAAMLELTGESATDASSHAQAIMKFETSLAGGILEAADRRDPDKVYHMMTLAELNAMVPAFDWRTFLAGVGIPEGTPVNVTEPELVKKFGELLANEPVETWKTWLRWRVLKLSAPYLAKPVAQEEFHFSGTILNGVKEQEPRGQTCVAAVDRHLSDELGQAFAARYFTPEAKRRVNDLIENLRAVMRDEITHSDWMQPETRRNALAKLNALTLKIGYPDRWRDYADLQIDRDHWFENIRGAWIFDQQYKLGKIGKPASRVDWSMTTPTVNAYSNSGQVEVVFPAGILQPPFFDVKADDANNYGAIGAVIGHEMGHQFDDSGSRYDATGNLRNWWTPADRRNFDFRASCVVREFNTLDVGNGVHHNGRLVLGEAMGDLGGLAIAYKAWKRSLAGKPTPPAVDGFTAEQRFFIAFARVWGTQQRPEAMQMQLSTNPHPIAKWRAIGTLRNMPEFQAAFQCKDGDPMVAPAAERCKLW